MSLSLTLCLRKCIIAVMMVSNQKCISEFFATNITKKRKVCDKQRVQMDKNVKTNYNRGP